MAEGQTHLNRHESNAPGERKPDPKCSCCDKRYKSPIYLPCGHTVNKQCVLKLKSSENGKCVVCKNKFNVNAAEKFPPNYFLERLATLARCHKFATEIKKKKPRCTFDDHAETTHAVIYCSNCKIHLCERCQNLHNKIPEAQKHAVYFSESKKTEQHLNVKFQYCKEHRGKEITSWCSSCNLAVCDECCDSKHKMCDIFSQAREAKNTLKNMDIDLEKLLSIVKANQTIIKENETHLESNSECVPVADSQLRLKIIQGSVDDIIKQCLYLQRDIQLLRKHAVDIEVSSSLKHVCIQWKNIRSATDNIDPRPESSSSSEISSVLDSTRSSLRSMASASIGAEETSTSLQNLQLNLKSKSSSRTAVIIHDDEHIYMNEMRYDDTEVVLRKPINEDSSIFTQQLNKFDVQFRITGMTLLNDVIVVASRSAGLCAGYSYEAPGIQIWNICEKLNGPFDLDSYRSEKQKHYLFISDPGQTVETKGSVRVYERRANARYKHFKTFTTECNQPKGLCVFGNRVYICESEQRQVTEYNISSNLTGKILRKYSEPDVLKEPIYVAAQVINEKVILIISDNQIGLKRLVKGEDTGDSKFPAWAVSKEKTFTPSKCFTTKRSGKSEVFIGNSSGHTINLIDFESRQVNHHEYRLDDECCKPVAIAIIKDQAVVACKDGTIFLYGMNEATRVTQRPILENIEENDYEL